MNIPAEHLPILQDLCRSSWPIGSRRPAGAARGLRITTLAYEQYLDTAGLRQLLPLLLERKPFEEMRWEELWDLGLRIRSLFLNTPLPERLTAEITAWLPSRLTCAPVTVRYSAPAEDSAAASFAGLHDSFVNVYGLPAILDRLRLV